MAKKTGARAAEDRRESPRIPMSFLVRDVGRAPEEWEERSGDLSVGGIFWRGSAPPHSADVEVRFRLPGVPKELRAKGEIIRVKDRGTNIDFHVRFTELSVECELAIAKHLDGLLAGE